MKTKCNFIRIVLSGLCLAVFIIFAAASGESSSGSGSSGDVTPLRIDENPESDYVSDIEEDERESEEVYQSSIDEEEPADTVSYNDDSEMN